MNPHIRSQSPLCYHYTIPLSVRPANKCYYTMLLRFVKGKFTKFPQNSPVPHAYGKRRKRSSQSLLLNMISPPESSAVRTPSHSGENATPHHCMAPCGAATHQRSITARPMARESSNLFFIKSTVHTECYLSMDGFFRL